MMNGIADNRSINRLIIVLLIIVPICLTQRQLQTGKTANNRQRQRHELSHFPLKPIPSQDKGLVTNEFVGRKVKVVLSCEPEETVIKLNFTEPFRGLVLAGNTNSPCRIKGDGQLAYVLRVPHNSCDTEHVISKGSFVNKLFVRYHPSLEMGGDHSKTIVCKFGIGSFNVS